MYIRKKATYLFIGSVVLVQQVHTASWLGFKSGPTQQDTALYRAVEANDLAAAFNALERGANPNKQLNGTSIFEHAFEHAVNRDWQGDNKVIGVDEHQAQIAYLLAQKGGDLQVLNNYIATEFKPHSFKHESAKRVFDAFVQKLKTEAEKF